MEMLMNFPAVGPRSARTRPWYEVALLTTEAIPRIWSVKPMIAANPNATINPMIYPQDINARGNASTPPPIAALARFATEPANERQKIL
jgi:hypothetical protein